MGRSSLYVDVFVVLLTCGMMGDGGCFSSADIFLTAMIVTYLIILKCHNKFSNLLEAFNKLYRNSIDAKSQVILFPLNCFCFFRSI